MPAKPKTCGQCAHTEKGGEKVVWCFGAPPTVLSASPAENGGMQVQVQSPLLPIDRRACAVFKAKR
jgi:hypothetical protein